MKMSSESETWETVEQVYIYKPGMLNLVKMLKLTWDIKIAKLGMFGLGMILKEGFLTYSTQFIFLIVRLVSGNVVIVAIDMCRKSAITGEWIYGVT